MRVEFAGGGPADGKVQEEPGTPETLLVYELAPGKLATSKPEDHPSVITHVYRSAHRITNGANHIFTYRGRART